MEIKRIQNNQIEKRKVKENLIFIIKKILDLNQYRNRIYL